VICFVFVRRLKPGRTYEDFLQAWYPDQGFGVDDGRVYLAVKGDDPREVLTVGFLEPPEGDLHGLMQRIAAQEATRHDRIAEVIEETTLRSLYDVVGNFDFSTDAAVAAARPPEVDRE
jgi:hypothetical protein